MDAIITVAEYVAWRQPFIASALWQWHDTMRLIDYEVPDCFGWWDKLMRERPLPGRAGLLPGEDRRIEDEKVDV